MDIQITNHAQQRLLQRKIEVSWVIQAVNEPEMILQDEDDDFLEHRLAIITDAGYKILRVICDPSEEPIRIITAFFDPEMKGKL